MSAHCWHASRVQYSTGRPGEVRKYICCNCGRTSEQAGYVEPDPTHGPYFEMPPVVTYVLPKDECVVLTDHLDRSPK